MRRLTFALVLLVALLLASSASSAQNTTPSALPLSTAAAAPEGMSVLEGNITVGLLPSALALDSQTGRLYVANNGVGTGSVSVIDVATRQVVATVPTGVSPAAFAMDPDRQVVYVMNRGSDNVVALDTRTNTVIGAVGVGRRPHAMWLDVGTQRLYVLNRKSNDLSVIDTLSRREAQRIPVGRLPFALAVDPATQAAFVLSEGDNSVYQVDLKGGQVTRVAGWKGSRGIAMNTLTHRVYISRQDGLGVLDAQTGQILADIPLLLAKALAVDAVRNVVYAAGLDRLYVIDGATHAVRYILLEYKPTDQTTLLVDTSRQRVYAAHWNDGVVSVVSGATGRVQVVPAGQNPNALALDDTTHQVYVANTSWEGDGNHQPGSVSVIGFQSTAARGNVIQGGGGGLFLGLNLAAGDSYTSLARAQQINAGYMLVPIKWADVQPQRTLYNWSALDAILQRAGWYGLKAVLRIYRAPAWARPAGSSDTAPPTDLNDLGSFMRDLVGRYGSLFEGYVIWNEPNLPEEWGGNPPNAAAYVNLLSAAYTGAKTSDPSARIVSAGLAPTQGGNGAVNDLTFLQQMYTAGLTQTTDVIGMNGLGFAYAPDDTSDPNGLNFARLAALHQVMVNKGHTNGVAWALEVGWLQDTTIDLGGYNWMKVPLHLQGPYILRAIQKAEQEWPWLTGLFIWNGDYDRWTPTTDQKHWFALSDWARYLMGPMQPPSFTRPVACGVTNQVRPVFEGTSVGAMTTTLSIDGNPAYTTTTDVVYHFAITPANDLATGQHIITANGIDVLEGTSGPSTALTLTVSPTLLFDPLGVALTYHYPGMTWSGARVPKDGAGCVDPSGWRLSLSPGAATTVTVPISCAVTPVVTFTYGAQRVPLNDAGGALFRGVFTPTWSDAGSFTLTVGCGATVVAQNGQALIDPDGTVYDARLGLSHPISGAVVTCERQDDLGQWHIWNAWDYAVNGVSQINPQTTGQDGYYSFMTPPGDYRLWATRTAYRDFQSDSLSVIDQPVHLDIPLWNYVVYLPLVLKNYTPPPTNGPDLIVSNISVNPAAPAPGQQATVYVTVKNRGNQAANNWFFIHLYVDHTPTGRADVNQNWAFGPYTLAPGATFQASISMTFTAGNHNLYAQADTYWGYGSPDYGNVQETDENNNILGPIPLNVSGLASDMERPLPSPLPSLRPPAPKAP